METNNEYAPWELDRALEERERRTEAYWDAVDHLDDTRLALAAINQEIKRLRSIQGVSDE